MKDTNITSIFNRSTDEYEFLKRMLRIRFKILATMRARESILFQLAANCVTLPILLWLEERKVTQMGKGPNA